MLRTTVYGQVMKYLAIPLAPIAFVAMEVGSIILEKGQEESITQAVHTYGLYLHFYGWVGMFAFFALVVPLIIWQYWYNVSPHAFIEAVETHIGVEEILLEKARAFKRASDADDHAEMERVKTSYEHMKRWITSKGYVAPHFSDLLNRVAA
jgi:hypothetical protein